MHLAIVGSRYFHDYNLLKTTVDDYVISTGRDLLTIISGGVPGTDALAERYARETNTMFVVFNANWSKYGRSAGQIRNRLIAEECTDVIAFRADSLVGTVDTLTKASAAGKKCVVIIV